METKRYMKKTEIHLFSIRPIKLLTSIKDGSLHKFNHIRNKFVLLRITTDRK